MKTKVSLLIACLLITLTGFAFTNEKVEGNGNIITKEISISDYNEISTVGVMEFVYEQSDAAPYLKIMIDENLFPLLRVQVDGKELIIGPKKIKENSRNGNSYNLQPTKFKVITNSREIKELNVVSSGDFIIASPINIGKLEINMAGSGNILLEKKVRKQAGNQPGQFWERSSLQYRSGRNRMQPGRQRLYPDCRQSGPRRIQSGCKWQH